MPKSNLFNVRIDGETKSALDRLARFEERSKSQIVRRLIKLAAAKLPRLDAARPSERTAR